MKNAYVCDYWDFMHGKQHDPPDPAEYGLTVLQADALVRQLRVSRDLQVLARARSAKYTDRLEPEEATVCG